MELNLKRVFSVLMRRWLPIVLAMCIFGVVVFIYSAFLLPPTYRASTMLYVTSDSSGYNSSITSGQLSVAQSLIGTYVVVLKSYPVLEQVLEKTNLDYTVDEVKEMITAEPVDETGVFTVSVTCHDPVEAQELANAVANYGAPAIVDKVKAGAVSIVEAARIPKEKSGPNVLRNTLLGVLIGGFLMALLVVILDLCDTRLRNVGDAAAQLDLPLLGTVDDYSDLISDNVKAGWGNMK